MTFESFSSLNPARIDQPFPAQSVSWFQESFECFVRVADALIAAKEFRDDYGNGDVIEELLEFFRLDGLREFCRVEQIVDLLGGLGQLRVSLLGRHRRPFPRLRCAASAPRFQGRHLPDGPGKGGAFAADARARAPRPQSGTECRRID
ncbi:hypothetical protein ACVWZV_009649 [Bradyrhizobium sp. GM5.1]